jgi:hypothetical protein
MTKPIMGATHAIPRTAGWQVAVREYAGDGALQLDESCASCDARIRQAGQVGR